MSHHIYHTRGIILSSASVGESNRFYKIFTEELGLIGGAAQSVREGRSKLRYTLQDLSFVNVDLVRGKEIWRIVSAGVYQQQENLKEDLARVKLFARYCALLLRLVQGEGRDQELFEEIIKVAGFLETHEVPQDLVLSFETLSQLRLLVHLGYIDKEGYGKFLDKNTYSIGSLVEFEKIRLEAIPKITTALNASHL